ncbi:MULTISPECIES: hypothetical protein [Streptomyces]|uniref:Uncharacterized protein n=1 Tax=Streptomyces fradiae ATCC 10745 = DSM 40063 TaxID=1319510 RepID=A0A1Y2NTG9_STRFR|nr:MULTISPECIES: hypothetical protein [Streptomyces]OSY50610.1 hypothetical protein BG846_03778 [Streptomyces fradiae ATCC 10745 = DSM 40063]
MTEHNPWGEPSTNPRCTTECILCGAPGGYPYCNTACETADNPYDDEDCPTT